MTQATRTPPVGTGGPRALGHVAALDGLRAIAALMVLTTHVAFQTGLVAKPIIGPITSRMDFGVCVFFLLSGFLLYRPWSRAAMLGRPGPRLGRYARKRVARVYPAYAVLVVVVLGWYVTDAPAPVDQWLAYLSLGQIYVNDMSVSTLNQTWSVATEVSFYVALPLVGWFVLRRHRGDPDRSARWQLQVLAALVAIAVAFQLVRTWTDLLPGWISSFWLPGFLDWFALGMALAVVQTRWALPGSRRGAPLAAMAAEVWTCLIVAGLLFALAATPLAGTYYVGIDDAGAAPWSAMAKHYLYGGCAFFLLLPLVLGPASHAYPRSLAHPLARWVGLISYGIFLWHLLVLSVLADLFGFGLFQGGFWLLWPTTILGSCLVAAASWYLLERPILRRAHRGSDLAATGAPGVTLEQQASTVPSG